MALVHIAEYLRAITDRPSTGNFLRTEPKRNTNMPYIDQMIESKYLKKEDIGEPGDGVMVTIQGLKQANIAREDEDPDQQWLIKFKEFPKPMVLKPTNMRLAAMILGSKNTDDWIGKRIEIFHDPSITFGDKMVGGMRFRARGKTKESPVVRDDFNDEVPF